MTTQRVRTVGIDFGTSTTLIAERQGNGLPNVLPIGHTTSWLPSIVGISARGEFVVGEEALQLPLDRQIGSIKSELTRGADEVETAAGTVAVHDAIAAILEEAIRRAKAVDQHAFDGSDVYMGCPALWTGHERSLLVDVVQSIGLDVDVGQIIDEPVAAGLEWMNSRWLGGGDRPTGKALIFDAGGGTLDVAYLDVVGGDEPVMTVLSAEGVDESGDALDRSIADDLLGQLDRIADDDFLRRLVLVRARDLKEALSTATERRLPLGEPFETILEYRRTQLERAFEPQLERAIGLVASTIRGSLLRVDQPMSPTQIRNQPWADLAHDVGHVALVGGLSQVPAVGRAIAALLPTSQLAVVDRPQESVVRGLVNGDQLAQLNLPRPPIDFCVEFPGFNGQVDPAWLAEHRVVYHAFTPLYSPDELMRGTTLLGYQTELPAPPRHRGTYDISLRCEVPDRRRTPLTLRLRTANGEAVAADGIRLRHDGRKPAMLKLYTNGDLVVTSSHTSYRARVRDWPRIRGKFHDWHREIEIWHPGESGPSELAYDNWRFQ